MGNLARVKQSFLVVFSVCLKRGHGVTAGNIFPLGRGLGPMMERMDCLANFGPLQADFNCVKHCKRKVVKYGVVSVLLGV